MAKPRRFFNKRLRASAVSGEPSTALCRVALNNLAVVYKEQGKLAAAEAKLRESLRIQEAIFGADSVAAAAVANNLGEVRVRQARYAEAEILYRRTLRITEQALGAEHPDVANQLANLASLLTYQGRANEAEGLLRRALTITETAFGPDHPDVATSANNLAHAISSQHRLQEAEVLYRRSLAIREAHFGPDNPSVAIALDNLGGAPSPGLPLCRGRALGTPLARDSRAVLGSHPSAHGQQPQQSSKHSRQPEAARRGGAAASESARGARGRPGRSSPRGRHQLAQPGLALSRSSGVGCGATPPSSVPAPSGSAPELGFGRFRGGPADEIRNNADPFLGLVVAAYHAAAEPGQKPHCDCVRRPSRARNGSRARAPLRRSRGCRRVSPPPTIASQSWCASARTLLSESERLIGR